MKLKVLVPTHVLLSEEVQKVTFEAEDGVFTMLPRHIDFASSLVPGIFSYVRKDGSQGYIATSKAVLIKEGDTVTLSSSLAVASDTIDDVHAKIKQEVEEVAEEMEEARNSLNKLEVGIIRRFMEISD